MIITEKLKYKIYDTTGKIFTKNGKEFYRKVFSRGGDSPKITLETVSGYVKLEK